MPGGNFVDLRSAEAVLESAAEICTGLRRVPARLYQCDYVSDFKFLIRVVADRGWRGRESYKKEAFGVARL